MIRKTLAACALAIALPAVMALPAQAKGPVAAPTTVITVNDKTGELPAAQAAAAWNKANAVTLDTGSCSGVNCVNLVVAAIPSVNMVPVMGYASPQADGSCTVTVDPYTVSSGANLLLAVTTHELGHCIGLGHVTDDRRSIMQPVLDGSITAPDRRDLRNLAALYGG